jgi:hypothetical protein
MRKLLKQIKISTNQGRPTKNEALGIDPNEYAFRGLTEKAKKQQEKEDSINKK